MRAGSATSAGPRAVLITQESRRWGGVAKPVLPPSASGIGQARGDPSGSASRQHVVSGRITWGGAVADAWLRPRAQDKRGTWVFKTGRVEGKISAAE